MYEKTKVGMIKNEFEYCQKCLKIENNKANKDYRTLCIYHIIVNENQKEIVNH